MMRVVVGVGQEALEASRVAAERRGAALFSVSEPEEVRGVLLSFHEPTRLLVVASCGRFGADAFYAMHEAAVGRAEVQSVGFLYGRSGAQLLQAAGRLPAYVVPGDANLPQRYFSFSDTDEYVFGTPLESLPEDADAVRRTAALEEDVELAFLQGHGNGHDAGMRGVALCAHPGVAVSAQNVFPCYHGGRCRFDAAQIRAWDVRRLGARRAVVLICWTISLAGHPFDPAWSIGEALFERGHVRTVLGLVCAAVTRHSDTLLLYYLLNDGFSMGEAAVQLARYRREAGLGADIFCFGDPEERVAGSVRRYDPQGGAELAFDLSGLPFGLHNVRLTVPRGISDPAGLALLDHKGAPVAGVRSPEGDVYLSVDGSRMLKMRVRCVPAMISETESSNVRGDLALLRAACRGLADNAVVAELARECLGRIEVLESGLGIGGGPLQLAGSVMSSVLLQDHWLRARSVRRRTMDAALELFSRSVASIGGLAMTRAWKSSLRRLGRLNGLSACPHCGQGVEIFRNVVAGTTAMRFDGVCRGCGPIYSGPQESLGALSADPFEAGCEVEVRTWATNPLESEVEARFVAMLAPFGDGPACSAESAWEAIGGGQRQGLSTRLCVDGSLNPGVYYLSGALAIGTELHVFRSPVRVRARDTRLKI